MTDGTDTQGRPPNDDEAMSNAERQAEYRRVLALKKSIEPVDN